MKINILLLLFAILTFSSCKKEKVEEQIDDQNIGGGNQEEVIPDTFVKRAVVEKFTGEWCGYCPSGAQQVDGYKTTHGDKLIVVDVHGGDPFQTTHTNYLDHSARFNITGYPSAVVDRTKSTSYTSGSWESKINTAVSNSTDVGIKLITTIDSNKLNVEAHVVSNSAHPDAYITILVVEDNVPESANGAQSNYTGPTGNYIHQHVLRAKLNTIAHGDKINLTEARKEYILTWNNFDISSYKINDLKVVAIVHDFSYINNNLTQAYNSREVKAGESTDWN